MLAKVAKNWDGPISAAVYCVDRDPARLYPAVWKNSGIKSRSNIEYHLVYAMEVSSLSQFYPIFFGT